MKLSKKDIVGDTGKRGDKWVIDDKTAPPPTEDDFQKWKKAQKKQAKK